MTLKRYAASTVAVEFPPQVLVMANPTWLDIVGLTLDIKEYVWPAYSIVDDVLKPFRVKVLYPSPQS